MKRLGLVLVGVVLAWTATGCGAVAAGPVALNGGEGGDHVTNCLPQASTHDFALGFNVLRNSGTMPVEITSVRIDRPHGVALLGSYVAPITKDTVFDTATPWPVVPGRIDPNVRSDWARRELAVGPNRLAPFASDSAWSLVLHLRASGNNPSIESVTVAYRTGDRNYSTTGHSAVEVKQACS